MKYVSKRAVFRLIGNHLGVPPVAVAVTLDRYLVQLNTQSLYGEKSIPDRLVAMNEATQAVRFNEQDRSLVLDCDVRLTVDQITGKMKIDMVAYFHHTEFARPPGEQRVVLHIQNLRADGSIWAIHAPLQPLLKGWGDVEAGHQGYSHGIAFIEGDEILEEHFYIGITKRGWLNRMAEHLREVHAGSNKSFHQAWRAYQGRSDVIYNSELVILNDTFERAMNWEEWLVDRYMAEGRSLNMIPGGFKGIKFLHKHRMISQPNITLEERETAIENWVRRHPRAGIPNFLVAKLWEDDAFAERIICGPDNRLSIDQVRRIRELASSNVSVPTIADMVGARSVEQVERLLSGKTYSRVR